MYKKYTASSSSKIESYYAPLYPSRTYYVKVISKKMMGFRRKR